MTLKINIDGVNRDMTVEEQTAYLAWQAEKQAIIAQNEQAAANKTKAKQAVLDKLGLTADDVAALFS